MAAGTLIKDPTTGAFTLAPGAGTAPLAPRSAGDLMGGGAIGMGGGDPNTAFNMNIASILRQIQQNASKGRTAALGTQNALETQAVGAAGAYNPQAAPDVNLQNQEGTMGAFAPAISSISTQVQNTDSAIKDLETTIGAIQEANKPEVLSPGQSLVTKGGKVLLNGVTYSVNPDPTNPGKFVMTPQNSLGAPGSDSGGGGNSSGGNSSIESIFGHSNPMGAYATDKNYVQEITGLYNTVSSLGVTGTPESLQKYIDNNAKGSPVTSQMILNAASTYGVDPSLLTTVLLHESDFGTAGVGAKTMNPGNQGNTGTSTKSYPSWQQGVMATASNLANRMSAAGTAPQNVNTTSPSSGIIDVNADAQALANGTVAPQVVQDRYQKAGVGVLYMQVINKAKQLNPSFNETTANLKYQGQQTQTENMNSGNPITSIFSNFKNAASTPSILSPAKGKSGVTSTGMGYTILP